MFIHTLGEHFTRHCCEEEEAMRVFVRSYYFAAAQVLSKSVYNALVNCDDETTLETRKFVIMFDRFFDCLNVRSPSEWYTHKKPALLQS